MDRLTIIPKKLSTSLILIVIGTLFLLAGCDRKLKISGQIDGLTNDTLLVTIAPLPEVFLSEGDNVYIDTICSVNGRFEYYPKEYGDMVIVIDPKQGFYERLSGGEYHPESNSVFIFWSGKNNVDIKGGYISSHTLDYSAEGGSQTLLHSQNRSKYLDHFEKATSIEIKLDSLMFYKGNEGKESDINSLFQERNQETRIIREKYMEFISNHPDNELSAFYITQIPFDLILEYESKLSEEIRNGLYKPIIDDRVRNYRDYLAVQDNKANIAVGKIAPDFELKSIEGESISLSSFDKEFIVLDFWGSWCGWCIVGFPKMKEYHEKYRDRVEFVGIACNDKDAAWREAVNEYQLNWPQLFNEKDNNVAVKYAIEAYPTKIILNKERQIVAIFKGESEEFYNKLASLLDRS